MSATICEVPCFINALPGKLVAVHDMLQAPFKGAQAFDTGYLRGARVEMLDGSRYDVYFHVDPGTSKLVTHAVECLKMKGIGNAEKGREEAA